MTMNMIEIEGYKAAISYDPEIEMFRGEFLNLNGGADFYAADAKALKVEAQASLRVFLEVCKEQGIEPARNYSGKFNVRVKPELHKVLAMYAEAEHSSLNSIVVDSMSSIVELAERASIGIFEVHKYLSTVLGTPDAAAKNKVRHRATSKAKHKTKTAQQTKRKTT